MAFLKLTFKPGINRDQTDYSGEGGWFAMNRARFRSGFPESIGGWVKGSPFAFHGVSRGFHNWITTFFGNFLAIGTNSKLYIEQGGNFFDITPLRSAQPVIGPPGQNVTISAFINTARLVVSTSIPHLATVNSFVTISGVVAPIGGVPAAQLNDNFQILSIENPTQFTILSPTLPTSTETGGAGVAVLTFQIEPGQAIGVSGSGWGVGTWGRNAWGLGANTTVQVPQRDWFYDNIDNDLVANIRNGPVYYWTRGPSVDPTLALQTPAVLLSSLAAADGFDPNAVPTKVGQIIMSQQDRHLLAFGATPFGSISDLDYDPLLIRWADQDNWTQWTPTPLNSAGFLKVSRGSKIIRALPVRQEFLVWTDAKLFALQFLGTTDVFGLQEYAETVSIISPRACITASNVTYWMGEDKFYAYTGRVETLPCTLRDHVFNDINRGQTEHIVVGLNEQWNEVWWFYPSALSQFNDKYVIYNYAEQAWYYGDMNRTAWLDSPMRDDPQAARIVTTVTTPNHPTLMSYLLRHEVGVDDEDFPLNSFIQSNDFDLGDGDQFMLTQRLIPDLSFEGSMRNDPSVKMQIRPRNFPGKDPFPDAEDTQSILSLNITNYTDQVFMRARARQMAFKIISEEMGVSWQVGNSRLDVRPDGRR